MRWGIALKTTWYITKTLLQEAVIILCWESGSGYLLYIHQLIIIRESHFKLTYVRVYNHNVHISPMTQKTRLHWGNIDVNMRDGWENGKPYREGDYFSTVRRMRLSTKQYLPSNQNTDNIIFIIYEGYISMYMILFPSISRKPIDSRHITTKHPTISIEGRRLLVIPWRRCFMRVPLTTYSLGDAASVRDELDIEIMRMTSHKPHCVTPDDVKTHDLL